MLKAKHIPFEVEYADFNNCLFDISPNGKAPIVITENNTVLFDADAIVSYLDKQYSGLLQPRSAEDIALFEAWANYGSKQYVPQCSTMRSIDEAEFKQHWVVFEKALINMEKQLGSSVFFFGDELSRVDIAWLPILHRAWLVEKTTGHDMFRDFPNIKRWQGNVMQLEWLMATVSADFEEIFNRFYLSNTFLSNV
ncbi:glutathione S-transferase family protein [Vibrio owensii]|uniref:glutathione S-transferase family protein n=1 Tax=Vibrio owensii TaxID=696485 RepID=UPI0013CE50D2|nr:glutathione S-transferase family protein [Vibrio owensii]